MAQKTLIGGTDYQITKGRTLVDGTGYDIFRGRTLVDGTGYDIIMEKITAVYKIPRNHITSNFEIRLYTADGTQIDVEQLESEMCGENHENGKFYLYFYEYEEGHSDDWDYYKDKPLSTPSKCYVKSTHNFATDSDPHFNSDENDNVDYPEMQARNIICFLVPPSDDFVIHEHQGNNPFEYGT